MPLWNARGAGLILAAILAAAPASAEVNGVTFKTTNAKVGFL